MGRILAKDISYEDCVQFKIEHPDVSRTEMGKIYCAYMRAMKNYGILDELYPSKYIDNKAITYEDCLKFKEEYPDMLRNDIASKYCCFHKAMIRLKCYDKLYPQKVHHRVRYTDDELIEIASKYETVRDMKEHDRLALTAIYHHGIKDKALAHMKPLGDIKRKLIYAFEFPDNSVYVGLTYDAHRRYQNHMNKSKNSAVKRHILETGLTPEWKILTDYVPVEEAKKLEGDYVEKYRSEGWNILNVAATGGTGGTPIKVKDYEIVELAEQGLTANEISKKLSIGSGTVYTILKRNHVKPRNSHQTPIAFYDKDGNLFKEFSMVSEAANYFSMLDQNLWQNIRRGYKVRGYIPVLLKEPMRAAS